MKIPSSSVPSNFPLAGTAPAAHAAPAADGDASTGAGSGAALSAFAAVLDASIDETPSTGPTVAAAHAAGTAFPPSCCAPADPIPAAALDPDEETTGEAPVPARRAPRGEDSALPATAMYFVCSPTPVAPAAASGITSGTVDATADLPTTCEPAADAAPNTTGPGPDKSPATLCSPRFPAAAPAASEGTPVRIGADVAEAADASLAPGGQTATDGAAADAADSGSDAVPPGPPAAPNGNGDGIGLQVRKDLGLPSGRHSARGDLATDWTPPGKDASPSVGELVREIAPANKGPIDLGPPSSESGASPAVNPPTSPPADTPPADLPSPTRTRPPAVAADNTDVGPSEVSNTDRSSGADRQVRQEKNADFILPKASIARPPGVPAVAQLTDDRSLALDDDPVNRGPVALGIAGASSTNAMRQSIESPVAESSGRSREPAFVTGVRELSIIGPAAGAPPAPLPSRAVDIPVAPAGTSAHAVAAIEATVDAVNHARLAGHSSVELKLTFADSTQLAVRVELRDGAVHTTFRTDSAELRDVLAQEWTASAPALAAASRAHDLRIADPVFDRGTPGFLALGSSTGGQSHSREMPTAEPVAAFARGEQAREATPADPLPAASPNPKLNGSSLLNTFA